MVDCNLIEKTDTARIYATQRTLSNSSMTDKAHTNNFYNSKMSESGKHDAHKVYIDLQTTYLHKYGITETPLHYLYYSTVAAKSPTIQFLSKISNTLKDEHITKSLYCNYATTLTHPCTHIQYYYLSIR